MAKIFISYRRHDSADATDSIYMQLEQHFGSGNVFLDVGSIPFGVDFRQYLSQQIQLHDVILVIIGKDWTRIMQERSQQANDFVRIEIENALQQDKLVIPVLVQNAHMPDFSQLPASIADLQWRNSTTIRRLPDLVNDCQRLADNIKAYIDANPTTANTGVHPTNPSPAIGTIPPLREANLEKVQGGEVESALQRAHTFTGIRNSNWTPFFAKLGDLVPKTPLPDLEMCLVPVGKFIMGSSSKSHRQSVEKPYWIAKYPTTNTQWAKGVQANAVIEPKNGDPLGWYQNSAMSQCPVVGVNWFESLKFALWIGCALPPENLWEYAARGVESLVYPWGNEFIADNVVYKDNSGRKPHPVTTKLTGASWVGALHMSGNVFEWQSSLDKEQSSESTDGQEDISKNNQLRVYRGGAWSTNNNDVGLTTYKYLTEKPDFNNERNGFRVFLPA